MSFCRIESSDSPFSSSLPNHTIQPENVKRFSTRYRAAQPPLISKYNGEDLFFGYAIIGNPAFAEWGYISFTELKQIRIPPGIEVDCELFDPPLKASEVEEIRTT
jgi:hypothetical protein